MVDWDRVEELRSKGWDWDKIAADPKVGFHPDASVQEAGRALRGLYHRERSRQRRRKEETPAAKPPTKEEREKAERKWTLPRVGYLLVPVVGIWFALAYLIPSPVGLLLPAIPWLALGLAVVAFILLFGLLRSSGARWSKVYRTTVVTGVVLGLVISAMIVLGSFLFFGCPFLPSTTTSQPAGWDSVNVAPWHENGLPVVFFYGATWCPYCSASSWAVYKALTEFGNVTGEQTGYSSSTDVDASTPELVLASLSFSSSSVSFQVAEDTSGVDGQFPSTGNCYQQAYFTAYGGSSIPFVAVNGQYVHGGQSLIDPSTLSTWAAGANGGAATVQTSVLSESGAAWSAVQTAAWWTMAFIVKATGDSVTSLETQYHWSTATAHAVSSDLDQLS